MLIISIVELIPESIKFVGTAHTLISIFLGAALVGSLDYIIPHIHISDKYDSEERRLLKSAYLITFGLILHDFPEGFCMANSYLINPSLGILISIAIAAHNIPEEFAMSIPIINLKSKKFIYTVALLSGLSEPAGAILGLIASNFFQILSPYLLSFSAGAMILVSIHELIPMSKKYGRYSIFVVGFLISILVYFALTILLPE
jgi:ZIP family zinc transporter